MFATLLSQTRPYRLIRSPRVRVACSIGEPSPLTKPRDEKNYPTFGILMEGLTLEVEPRTQSLDRVQNRTDGKG